METVSQSEKCFNAVRQPYVERDDEQRMLKWLTGSIEQVTPSKASKIVHVKFAVVFKRLSSQIRLLGQNAQQVLKGQKMSTATKSVRKSSFTSYDQLIKHTEKKAANRPVLKIGRGGASIIPRKFHLDQGEIEVLTAEYKSTGRFPNPHNKGFYFYLVEALVDSGVNEEHTLASIQKRVEKSMQDESTVRGEGRSATNAWDRWTQKDPRNEDTGKDWEARFDQNIDVLQRLTGNTPYGRKILDVGQKVMGKKGGVIDLLVNDRGNKYLRLNLNSDRPINESKVRGMGSPAAIAAERAEKRAERKAENVAENAVKPKAKAKPKAKRVKVAVETTAVDTVPEVENAELATV